MLTHNGAPINHGGGYWQVFSRSVDTGCSQGEASHLSSPPSHVRTYMYVCIMYVCNVHVIPHFPKTKVSPDLLPIASRKQPQGPGALVAMFLQGYVRTLGLLFVSFLLRLALLGHILHTTKHPWRGDKNMTLGRLVLYAHWYKMQFRNQALQEWHSNLNLWNTTEYIDTGGSIHAAVTAKTCLPISTSRDGTIPA
jgi:hypothetical protein